MFLNLLGNLYLVVVKIKRCGEMARRLRFFKEQMLKAGVSPKYSTTPVDVNIDDLEVHEHTCGQSLFPFPFYFFYSL